MLAFFIPGMGSMGYILMVLLPSMALSGGAAWLVKSRFNKYSKVPSQKGYTGQQAAQKLLDAAGISDVRIVRVDGSLTDHYNPTNKTLALSTPVFDQTSIAAIGVATHEAGHAIQHATSYAALGWRSMLVPTANIGSKFGRYGMMIGLAFMGGGSVFGQWVFVAGAALFSLLCLFQFITLPVEFNASNRAKRLVVEAGIVSPMEREGIDKVLNAAAMTYVASFVSSMLTLLYFLYRAGFLGGRR
jgi:Zn-dependent membrane protease YugP